MREIYEVRPSQFDLEPASQPIDLEVAQVFRYKAFGLVNESGLDRDEYDKNLIM